ncbi:MAG: N-formylglutamate deformylase [Pseudoruegeria sp.]
MKPVTVLKGTLPVVLAFPHSSTQLPNDAADDLNANGRLLSDTDWYLPKLYDGVLPRATRVEANFHRYVIDANRAPSGESLYPGQATTGLVPDTDFDGNSIRKTPLARAAQMQRLATYHDAYHRALKEQIGRVRETYGFAILYDCHSIRGQIPRLFDGLLPDLNIGTFDDASCDPTIAHRVEASCKQARDFTSVLNGRFKGGWTTRHYGKPENGVHAIQMEISQSTYLRSENAPWIYDPLKAEKLRKVLKTVLEELSEWKP